MARAYVTAAKTKKKFGQQEIQIKKRNAKESERLINYLNISRPIYNISKKHP